MPATGSSSPFTDPVPPPLIGALLRMSWETVREHMLRRLHESGFVELDTAHLTVFQYPGPQGARPSELAVRIGMSKQALNYLLGQLERLGYLERRDDPADQRSRRIELTSRGQSVVEVMRSAVAEVEAAWAKQLGAARFDELRGLLLELEQSRQAASSPT